MHDGVLQPARLLRHVGRRVWRRVPVWVRGVPGKRADAVQQPGAVYNIHGPAGAVAQLVEAAAQHAAADVRELRVRLDGELQHVSVRLRRLLRRMRRGAWG